jgi:SH3 domain
MIPHRHFRQMPHAFPPPEVDYNGRMDTSSRTVRVSESRPRDHVRNLSVRVGDVIGVGHRNQQYPELRWCTPERGHSGWMAESYFEYTSPTEAVVLRDYDASQLTVFEGEELDVLDQVGEWWLCRNGHGIQGWVPQRILEGVGAADS